MAFRVAARTILELGAELISSDAVAIYELVKNAIDARSTDGVTIAFSVALRHSDFTDVLVRATTVAEQRLRGDALRTALVQLRAAVKQATLDGANAASRSAIAAAVETAASAEDFVTRLSTAYAANNWIEFRDAGYGMSRDDVVGAYLLIGTPSRRRAVEDAVVARKRTPYLGEKGIGRLAAMRLGSQLHVETATRDDARLNVLDVDWDAFDTLDKLISDIPVEPEVGPKKADANFSGTTIRISNLKASWSPARLRSLITGQLARFSDPFAKTKRRFRILITFNGERIDVPRLDQTILDLANARVTGEYRVVDGTPQLNAALWSGDLGKGNPPEEKRVVLEQVDLRALTAGVGDELPASALRTVGPFSFEFHWFNRRLLRSTDTIGDRRQVLNLQEQWSGIMLFRDGYRVFPYGDEGDDWLELDRRALRSGGYKLNKTQFIGRVAISRTDNPALIDQTSREGLKDCPEKTVLLEMVRYIIQDRLRLFLDEIDKRQRQVLLDWETTEKRVSNLERRARDSIKALQTRHAEDRASLQELLDLFEEMRTYFARAKARAEQVEDERDRMVQLAGVGLMLEVLAHELARSTEHTLQLLDDASDVTLPAPVSSLVGTLRDEMKTMNRRLRVLDPLSISGRQRKETFDLVHLVRETLAAHEPQFRRHGIEAKVTISNGEERVLVHGVRGMFVQILENLLNNSVYWMELRRRDEADYRPYVLVNIAPPPIVLEYTDNGPGIQPTLRDEVFKPFFSTKDKTRRQGLGLYIARDAAEYHHGQLYLLDDRRVHRGRLNTFALEMPIESGR